MRINPTAPSYDSSAIKTTGSGSITTTGVGGNAGVGEYFALGYSNELQTTGTGNITISADSFSFPSSGSINSAGNLTVTEHTAGTTIGVGTNATGTLTLPDTQLGYFTYGGTLIIGDTNAGAVDINTGSSIANKNLTFISGGAIYLDKSGDSSPTALTDSGSSTTTLTFEAGTDIVTAGAINESSTGKLNVLMDSDTAAGGGAISIGGNITSGGGNITMGGDEATPSNIVAGTGYAVGDAANPAGVVINGATLSSGGGNIVINGTGYSVNTTNNSGILLMGGAQLQGGGGNISLTGTGSYYDGIDIYSGSGGVSIQTTNSGSIAINGTGTSSGVEGIAQRNLSELPADTGNVCQAGSAVRIDSC